MTIGYKTTLFNAVQIADFINIDGQPCMDISWNPNLEFTDPDSGDEMMAEDQDITIIDGKANVSAYVDGSDEQRQISFSFLMIREPSLMTLEDLQSCKPKNKK